MSTRVHFRSKIKMTLVDFSRDITSIFDKKSRIELNSVQSYDPQITTNADVNDSISSERIGYLIRPGRITIAVTVLAAKPSTDAGSTKGYSDAEIMGLVQFGRISFDILVEHDGVSHNDFGNSWTWESCLITDSNPSQLTIDGRPTAVFNMSALGVTTDRGTF